MLTALGATLLTTALAILCALLGGALLGRLATEFVGPSRLLARLTELRGALPTLVAAPLLDGWLHPPATVTLGTLVGAAQGLAVARWLRSERMLRRSASLAGAAPLSNTAPSARLGGAPLRSALALSLLHVVSLEALLGLLELPPRTVSLGSLMVGALAPEARVGAVLALACLLLILAELFERMPALRPPPAPAQREPSA